MLSPFVVVNDLLRPQVGKRFPTGVFRPLSRSYSDALHAVHQSVPVHPHPYLRPYMTPCMYSLLFRHRFPGSGFRVGVRVFRARSCTAYPTSKAGKQDGHMHQYKQKEAQRKGVIFLPGFSGKFSGHGPSPNLPKFSRSNNTASSISFSRGSILDSCRCVAAGAYCRL